MPIIAMLFIIVPSCLNKIHNGSFFAPVKKPKSHKKPTAENFKLHFDKHITAHYKMYIQCLVCILVYTYTPPGFA